MRMKYSDTLFKICFTTSQSLTINNKEKVYFQEENIKNLKREFKAYNALLNNVIMTELKKKDSQFYNTRLRVPLCALIEYKGVVGLAFDQSEAEDLLKPDQLRQDYVK